MKLLVQLQAGIEDEIRSDMIGYINNEVGLGHAVYMNQMAPLKQIQDSIMRNIQIHNFLEIYGDQQSVALTDSSNIMDELHEARIQVKRILHGILSANLQIPLPIPLKNIAELLDSENIDSI